MLNKLLKVTELVSGGSRISVQEVWLQSLGSKVCLFIHCGASRCKYYVLSKCR